jgi:hypothetical protein
MKRLFFAAALAVAALPALPALAADVRVLYREPMGVERVAIHRPPIYLRVPPGYARNWSKHCREYNACGERVYFVNNNWYQNEYAPHYQEHHRDNYDRRGDDHHDRGDNPHNNNDRDSQHGNGNDHGNNHGHGSNH